ncbi:MAG: multiprotein bridging factor aMBF1 [Salinirussus sp.]
MVQCEMCGTETADPNRVKIEGAELDVCDNCTEFGTEVRTEESTSSTSTKYSTSSGSSSSSRSSGRTRSGSTGGGGDEMFDDIEQLAQDYDDRIRTARESAGLSQEELAKQLNEKASLIRKLEHGDTLPSDSIQGKLERALDIDLSVSGDDDTEWSGGTSTGEYTLGDMVERKD